jgi:hypothetical protein
VAAHQAEDEIRGAADEVREARAALRAQERFEPARIELQPGNHLATVAAGSARADLARLEHRDRGAALGEVQRRRESRETTADDADVGTVLALKRWGR